MYHVLSFESGLWTVGFGDRENFEPVEDYGIDDGGKAAALAHAAELNGGAPRVKHEEAQSLGDTALREDLAAAALRGILSNSYGRHGAGPRVVAKDALEYADALIEELKKAK